MSINVQTSLDFGNARKLLNLPNATTDQEPATWAQLKSAIEGLSQKDNVRVATQANISLATPGATVDGIVMVSGDRVLVKAQTANTENGIYIWNGMATLMSRTLDANTFDELESALVSVDEGTNAGTVWRQTAVNGVLGTNAVLFVAFGTAGVQATEGAAGIAKVASQVITDAGTNDTDFITALKLATSVFAVKKFNQTIGDGAATSYTVTHNLNTRDIITEVMETSGLFRTVLIEIQRTSVNSVTVLFDVAPAAGAYRILIRA